MKLKFPWVKYSKRSLSISLIALVAAIGSMAYLAKNQFQASETVKAGAGDVDVKVQNSTGAPIIGADVAVIWGDIGNSDVKNQFNGATPDAWFQDNNQSDSDKNIYQNPFNTQDDTDDIGKDWLDHRITTTNNYDTTYTPRFWNSATKKNTAGYVISYSIKKKGGTDQNGESVVVRSPFSSSWAPIKVYVRYQGFVQVHNFYGSDGSLNGSTSVANEVTLKFDAKATAANFTASPGIAVKVTDQNDQPLSGAQVSYAIYCKTPVKQIGIVKTMPTGSNGYLTLNGGEFDQIVKDISTTCSDHTMGMFNLLAISYGTNSQAINFAPSNSYDAGGLAYIQFDVTKAYLGTYALNTMKVSAATSTSTSTSTGSCTITSDSPKVDGKYIIPANCGTNDDVVIDGRGTDLTVYADSAAARTFKSLTLKNHAILTHDAVTRADFGTKPTTSSLVDSTKRVDIATTSNVTIDATSKIDVSAKGYPGGGMTNGCPHGANNTSPQTGAGPGGGTWARGDGGFGNSLAYAGGGGHIGKGGAGDSANQGVITLISAGIANNAEFDFGSGGGSALSHNLSDDKATCSSGGAGGGRIRLNIGGVLNITSGGLIVADGRNGGVQDIGGTNSRAQAFGGAGAGGSIIITASRFELPSTADSNFNPVASGKTGTSSTSADKLAVAGLFDHDGVSLTQAIAALGKDGGHDVYAHDGPDFVGAANDKYAGGGSGGVIQLKLK